ncbi:hypothetical protein [Phycicoccus sp. Soil748]|uniref:hypothetical protein n=1 Tax=Phycicoccus sp. Soil748 TaxID=1736397 RepID=UPI00070369E3|nr:hypothetical protein [Phycicoccus sp. Soil748]KRE56096.1 hypothetical protein ASG70_02675 [Phycicoccus sp. Soil748]
MLSSISPLGERARASRWWVTTAAYLLGSAVGGLALGALASLLGGLVPDPVRSSSWSLALVAVLLLVGLGFDSQRGRLDLPSWRRQVDEQWLTRYRGWVYGVGFGAQLGFGLVTIITSATTYAVVLLAALGGDLRVGLAIGATFGVVRALPSLLMGGVADRAALHTVFGRVERWARSARIVARVTLGVAAAALLAVAVGS